MYRAVKYRIYPTKKQKELFAKTFGCVRYVYNHFLAVQKDAYKSSGKNLPHGQISKMLTELKKQDVFLKEADSISLQASIESLRDAYTNFFEKRADYPVFKKRRHGGSYTTKNVKNNIRIGHSFVLLPKAGRLRTKVHRKAEGIIKSACVSMTPSGRYYVSFCLECEDIPQMDKGNLPAVGIDAGLKDFLILSDGRKIENPRIAKKHLKKVQRLNRRLSRKQNGSGRKEKARLQLAREQEHIANIRKDFCHKLSRKLADEYSFIAAEDLSVKEMLNKNSRKMAFSIADASWHGFLEMLRYKCEWYGTGFQKIDKYYPSSQICHMCGYKNSETKNLSARKIRCPQCGTEYDRDINAAQNILNEGLRLSAL